MATADTPDRNGKAITAKPGEGGVVLASVVLQQLHDNAPTDHFTLSWVMGRLQRQSFSIVLLVLGIAALAPGVCNFAGLLIAMTAFQLGVGRAAPFFPRSIAEHPLPVRHLRRIVPHAITALSFIEKQIYPRWPALIKATPQLIGISLVLLSALLILIPIPFSNIVPALIVAMISLTYLEEDGLLLLVSLVVGLTLIGVNSAVVWAIIWTPH